MSNRNYPTDQQRKYPHNIPQDLHQTRVSNPQNVGNVFPPTIVQQGFGQSSPNFQPFLEAIPVNGQALQIGTLSNGQAFLAAVSPNEQLFPIGVPPNGQAVQMVVSPHGSLIGADFPHNGQTFQVSVPQNVQPFPQDCFGVTTQSSQMISYGQQESQGSLPIPYDPMVLFSILSNRFDRLENWVLESNPVWASLYGQHNEIRNLLPLLKEIVQNTNLGKNSLLVLPTQNTIGTQTDVENSVQETQTDVQQVASASTQTKQKISVSVGTNMSDIGGSIQQEVGHYDGTNQITTDEDQIEQNVLNVPSDLLKHIETGNNMINETGRINNTFDNNASEAENVDVNKGLPTEDDNQRNLQELSDENLQKIDKKSEKKKRRRMKDLQQKEEKLRDQLKEDERKAAADLAEAEIQQLEKRISNEKEILKFAMQRYLVYRRTTERDPIAHKTKQWPDIFQKLTRFTGTVKWNPKRIQNFINGRRNHHNSNKSFEKVIMYNIIEELIASDINGSLMREDMNFLLSLISSPDFEKTEESYYILMSGWFEISFSVHIAAYIRDEETFRDPLKNADYLPLLSPVHKEFVCHGIHIGLGNGRGLPKVEDTEFYKERMAVNKEASKHKISVHAIQICFSQLAAANDPNGILRQDFNLLSIPNKDENSEEKEMEYMEVLMLETL